VNDLPVSELIYFRREDRTVQIIDKLIQTP
jgi:hypothetical protein